MKKMRILAIVIALFSIVSLMFLVSCQKDKDGEDCAVTGEHDWTDWKAKDQATCTENGTQLRRCRDCKKEEVREDPDTATGHVYLEYKSNGDATCTTDGTETAVCFFCEGFPDTRPAEGSAMGHRFGATPVSTAGGFETYECLECKAHIVENNGLIDENFNGLGAIAADDAKKNVKGDVTFPLKAEGDNYLLISRSADRIVGETNYGITFTPDYNKIRNSEYLIKYDLLISADTKDLDILVGKKITSEAVLVKYDAATKSITVNGNVVYDAASDIAEGKWISFSYLMDDDLQKFDMYINNGLAASKADYDEGFPHAAALTGFAVRMQAAIKTASSFGIDNVKIEPYGGDNVIVPGAPLIKENYVVSVSGVKNVLGAVTEDTVTGLGAYNDKSHKMETVMIDGVETNVIVYENYASGAGELKINKFEGLSKTTISESSGSSLPKYEFTDGKTYEVYDLSKFDSVTFTYYCDTVSQQVLDMGRDGYKMVVIFYSPRGANNASDLSKGYGASYMSTYFTFTAQAATETDDGWRTVTIPFSELAKNREGDLRYVTDFTISSGGWGNVGVGIGTSENQNSNRVDGTTIKIASVVFNTAEKTDVTLVKPDDACEHTEKTETVIAPTCTSYGCTVETCSACGGQWVIGNPVEKTGHNYITINNTPVSCEENGFLSKKCLNCGDKTIKETPATGHSIDPNLYDDEGNYVYEIVLAGCVDDGVEKGICENCGTYVEIVLPNKGGHKYTLAFNEETKELCNKCSVCGEIESTYNYTDKLPTYAELTAAITAKGAKKYADMDMDSANVTGDNPFVTNEQQVSFGTNVRFVIRGNKLEVFDGGEGVGKYVKLHSKTEVADLHAHGDVFFSGISAGSNLVFELSVRLGNAGVDGKYTPGTWDMMDEKSAFANNTSRYTKSFASITEDGSIKLTASEYEIELTKDKFTHMAFVIKQGENKVDVYVDGVLLKMGLALINDAPGDMKMFQLDDLRFFQFHQGASVGLGSSFDIKDIIAYEGDAPVAITGSKYCEIMGVEHTDINDGLEEGAEGWNTELAATVIDPNCTDEGYTLHTCKYCGDQYKTDIVPANGHTEVTVEINPDYAAIVTDPTCTEGGYTTRHCSVCDKDYITDELEALGHDMVLNAEHELTFPAECWKDGSEFYECSRCDHTETKELTVRPGHSFGEFGYEHESAKLPTCTDYGKQVAVCTVEGCDAISDKTISPLGHSWDEGTITTDPTCTETGIRTKKCTREGCDATSEVDEPALGHDMVADEENNTFSDCAVGGTFAYKCTRCDYTETETVEPGAHRFQPNAGAGETNPWVTLIEATCSEYGYKTRPCLNPGCTVDQYSYNPDDIQCRINKEKHEFDTDMLLRVEPDGETDGYTYYKCKNCPEEQVVEIIPGEKAIFEINNAGYITGYNGEGGVLTIPAEIKGVTVTGVDPTLFTDAGITAVIIEAAIDLEGGTFVGLDLDYVVITADITYVAYGVFEGSTIGTLYYGGAIADLFFEDVEFGVTTVGNKVGYSNGPAAE